MNVRRTRVRTLGLFLAFCWIAHSQPEASPSLPVPHPSVTGSGRPDPLPRTRDVARILCLTNDPKSDPWPFELESALNESDADRPYVVFRAAVSDEPGAILGYLDRYGSALVASRLAPPDALRSALRSRGTALVIPEGPDEDAPKRAARAILARTAPVLGHWEGQSHPLPRTGTLAAHSLPPAGLYREVVRDHLRFDDFTGWKAAGTRLLAIDPGAADVVEERRRIGNFEGVYVERWYALRQSDFRATIRGLSTSGRASAFLESGKIRLAIGDPSGAERDFTRALKLGPADARASYGLARAIRDRPQESLAYAERAAQAAATPGLRSAAYRLLGEVRSEVGDAAGSRSSLARALASSGSDLESLRDMAWYARDRLEEAFPYALRASRAAARTPLWCRPAAYRLSARIWLDLKESRRALSDLQRALELDRGDPDASELILQLRQGGVTEALPPEDDHSGSGGPKDPAAPAPDDLDWLVRSIAARRDEGRLPEALALVDRFMEAIIDAPGWQQPSAYRLASRLWMELGAESDARVAEGRAGDVGTHTLEAPRMPKVRPPGAAELLWKAQVQIEIKDYVRAEETLLHAQALLSDDDQVLRMFIEAKMGRQEPGGALAYAEALLRTAGTDAERADAHRWIARVRLALKDRAAASENLKRALELVPDDPQTLAMLAEMKQAAQLDSPDR